MAVNRNDMGFEEFEKGHGKKLNQKLKPYLVLQYLLHQSDENNVISAENIVGYLQETCGIYAERRSIYRDIEEINKAMLIVEEEIDVHEAEERIAEDESERLIIYDKHKKGFYVRQRHFDLNDIRLLAECVYSAKFIEESKAKKLVNVVCEFVSEKQAEKIKHNAFLTDRVKTINKSVLNNISTINEAMSKEIDGEKHIPEKITFKYLKYSIDNMGNQVERRQGAKYVVSPFQLLINDGNYYLLAYDDYARDIRTYRVDRMKNVSYTGIPRDGQEAFDKIDLKSYTQRVFSMYGGEKKRVTLRFINPLLDTAIERFGTKDVVYTKVDDTHFSVTAQVEISNQFFGWILGFGNKVKLLSPDDVTDQFKAYLDKIRGMY